MKMVVTQSEIISQVEVESPLQSHQKPKNQEFPSLGRQSSIDSLTFDEFQHTICESGKNFGSMNMDEFLNSIWTAEENQAQAANNSNHTSTSAAAANATSNDHKNNLLFLPGEASACKGIAKQPSLPWQGSLALPGPLCRKTVDEVWSEINESQQEHQHSSGNNNNVQNPGYTQRQPTIGEMTLEDFLVRAGVVREQFNLPPPAKQQPYGLYQNNNHTEVDPSLGTATGGGGGASRPTYQTLQQGGVHGVGETSGYAGNGKRSGGCPPPPPLVCCGGRVGNAGGDLGLFSWVHTNLIFSLSHTRGVCPVETIVHIKRVSSSNHHNFSPFSF